MCWRVQPLHDLLTSEHRVTVRLGRIHGRRHAAPSRPLGSDEALPDQEGEFLNQSLPGAMVPILGGPP